MRLADQYPGIYKAALEIAMDNGGIHRGRSDEQQKIEFEKWLAARHDTPTQLLAMDAWLAGLNEDDLGTVTAGEFNEMKAKMKAAPPGTEDLLGDYFEEVC